MAQFYPEFEEDLRHGFSMVTEFAHVDFSLESRLFDEVVVRMTVPALSRTRIEFEFEYILAKDSALLAKGRQAVIWVNSQHRPSFLPPKLYRLIADNFGVGDP